MKSIAKNFVGIDVSKNSLDIFIYPAGKKLQLPNNQEGLNNLELVLADYEIEKIACEASGGYENLMFYWLKKHGFDVWKVQPRRIKAFIESEGVNFKTDASDAKMIALFVAQKECPYQPLDLSERDLRLQALVRRKDDLTRMANAEKTRLQQSQDKFCKKHIKSSITFIEGQIEAITKEIDQMINNDDELKRKAELVQSVPGVGPTTAAMVIAHLPELGSIKGKQAAALVGLAPYARQSGSYTGYAFIRGGRAIVRHILYMAALTASRYNKILSAFYQRLISAGKKPKVALIAVARKIVVVLNAMLRDKKDWCIG